jgi:hypothetical protein
MADLPTQTLRVLRFALELEAFTMPQLASEAGVGYETVKRVLRAEEGHTVRRTGDKTVQAIGRPAEVWALIDAAPIEARVAAAQEALSALEADTFVASEDREIAPADLYLAHAEDELVFALRADDPDDAAVFAAQALATLDEAGIMPPESGDPLSTSATLVDKWNLSTREARARIVKSVAEYVRSNEAQGLAGPLWRQAFRALASVELADQAALQRRFLVDLVRLADEHTHRIEALPHPELVDLLVRSVSGADGAPSCEELVSSLQSESQLSREAVRAALGQVVAEVAGGDRAIDRVATTNLLFLAQAAFPHGSETSEEVLQALVEGLCTLAVDADEQLAARAQDTLLAIHQPRQVSFWRRLAEASQLAPHRVAFVGLSHISVEEAFAYLRDALAGSASLEEVREALREGLPKVDRESRTAAQECFAEFLASISAEGRSQLVAVPALAGLDWPPPPFERPLVRHFFAMLTRWRAFVHGKHTDSRVLAQRDALGRELERLGVEVFPLLEDGEQRRLSYVLASEIHEPAAAAVCVTVLLELGLEADLARSLIEATAADDEAWASVTAWYLDVAPLDRLSSRQRSSLLNALRAALDRQESTFLIGLAGRAAESQEELRELTENPEIDSMLRFELEVEMTGSYGTAGQELVEVAAAFAGGSE